MDVEIVVATFGENRWRVLAMERAIPSAQREASKVHHVHGTTLADARNKGLARVKSEWVVFLDADDELEPGYVAALDRGTADLRAPAVRYTRGRQTARPSVPRVAGHRHACSAACLPEGNWCVIGTAMRTELVRAAGGWEEWPVYEDWALILRMYLAGATVEAIPEAVYRAHVNPQSRNRAPDIRFKNRVHHQIVEAVMPKAAAA